MTICMMSCRTLRVEFCRAGGLPQFSGTRIPLPRVADRICNSFEIAAPHQRLANELFGRDLVRVDPWNVRELSRHTRNVFEFQGDRAVETHVPQRREEMHPIDFAPPRAPMDVGHPVAIGCMDMQDLLTELVG